MIVVSDSTALIGLSAINGLEWLRDIYSIVIIPQAVFREVVIDGSGRPGSKEVATASWIQTKSIQNQTEKNYLMNIIGLDEGESEAIILATEIGADLLLVDDSDARRYAKEQQLKITGMIGVILAAKQLGLITSVRSQLSALITFGIFIDAKLFQEVCQRAGE